MSARADRIEDRLATALDLKHLEVVDESGNHNVPAGAESHFKVVAVAGEFAGMPRIGRHRRVNELLEDEFASGMHALALHTYTEDEWRARFGAAPMSPPCAGGEGAGGESAGGESAGGESAGGERAGAEPAGGDGSVG